MIDASRRKARSISMKFTKWIVMGSGSVILVLLSVVLINPKTVHALAAALVQITNTDSNPVPTTTAVPGTPFFGRVQLSGTTTQSMGPGTGTLGVTQITLTSSDTTVDQVNIFAGLLTNGTCGGTGNVGAGANPFLIFKVQPNSTLAIPFPTPLVFTPQDGYDSVNHTCLAAGMPLTGGNVFVTVNGFVN
jgi:hypothetical protein